MSRTFFSSSYGISQEHRSADCRPDHLRRIRIVSAFDPSGETSTHYAVRTHLVPQ